MRRLAFLPVVAFLFAGCESATQPEEAVVPGASDEITDLGNPGGDLSPAWGINASPVAGPSLAVTGPTVVDFEDLGIAVGTQISPPSGVGVTSQGFDYTPGPSNPGINDLHVTNQESFWSFNGTTVGGTHDDVVLTKSGGGTFSLSSFDFAGFPSGNEVPFTVTGLRGDATTIVQGFAPDGLVDGPGGVVDFETFVVTGDWSNLVSVTWDHTGAGTLQGLFAVDNIAVDQDPANKNACKKGGWAAFGFRNQGQCVRFIETGKDSR